MRSQQYNEANDKATFMNTLTACVNKVVKDGYVDSFKVTNRGMYSCSTDKYFKPDQVKIVNFYRFEGESDPADSSILYVMETFSGEKGTLIDAYGPYADEGVNKFMREIEEVNKKEVHSDSAEKEEQKPDIE